MSIKLYFIVMCINPKKILHRSNHFDVVQHPLYLRVPCGHCHECVEAQRHDWFVRCYFEYLEHIDRTLFYTLTYNPEHLPKYGKVAGFSKRHVQLFLKRLRKQLDVVDIKLKYIICCEYGEKNGRPHYHVLFFLSRWMSPYTFYKLVEKEWSVYVSSINQRVSLGFVQPGDNMGIVRGTAGIQYVTKYVVKDLSYISKHKDYLLKYAFDRYIKLFNYCKYRYNYDFDAPISKRDGVLIFKRPDTVEKDFSEFQQKILLSFVNKYNRLLQSALPFHLQSTKLGISSIDKVNRQTWKLPIMCSDGFRECSIPRYIRRKLWYDCLPNEKDGKKTRFVLSLQGIEHKLSTLDHDIVLREAEMVSCAYSTHLLSDIDDELLAMVNSALPKVSFTNVYDLRYFVEHIDLDFHDLAIYDVVFRGRMCDIDVDDERVLFDNYFDVAKYHYEQFSYVDVGKIYKYDRHLIKAVNDSLFDNLPCLMPYENTCVVLDSLQIAYRSCSSFKKERQEMQVRYLRDLYSKFT